MVRKNDYVQFEPNKIKIHRGWWQHKKKKFQSLLKNLDVKLQFFAIVVLEGFTMQSCYVAKVILTFNRNSNSFVFWMKNLTRPIPIKSN